MSTRNKKDFVNVKMLLQGEDYLPPITNRYRSIISINDGNYDIINHNQKNSITPLLKSVDRSDEKLTKLAEILKVKPFVQTSPRPLPLGSGSPLDYLNKLNEIKIKNG